MKVTNTSTVVMHVRGVEGVMQISPGKTANIQFTEEQLKKARARTFLSIEGVAQPEGSPAPSGLTAKHRGGGSYSVMDADGKEIIPGMSKDEAEAFNILSEEDKVTFVVNAGR